MNCRRVASMHGSERRTLRTGLARLLDVVRQFPQVAGRMRDHANRNFEVVNLLEKHRQGQGRERIAAEVREADRTGGVDLLDAERCSDGADQCLEHRQVTTFPAQLFELVGLLCRDLVVQLLEPAPEAFLQ